MDNSILSESYIELLEYPFYHLPSHLLSGFMSSTSLPFIDILYHHLLCNNITMTITKYQIVFVIFV